MPGRWWQTPRRRAASRYLTALLKPLANAVVWGAMRWHGQPIFADDTPVMPPVASLTNHPTKRELVEGVPKTENALMHANQGYCQKAIDMQMSNS